MKSKNQFLYKDKVFLIAISKKTKNIHYLEQKHWFYKIYIFYGRAAGFKVSEKFPNIDNTIDLDDNSTFLFSNDYGIGEQFHFKII
jgi:hypothetical protein